ncbi:hypothetical protein SLEP1_g19811 [Rubroshorea leprosula]|uniref:Uncharacterized protein n=1 Tax=Rubroshorea leprosula TaxID=152421 RepID=A0AAV5J861_9ROSI|nr:hypothetical protein SLEP1_g19811 [Rubroshorea leprosula]
MQAKEMKTVKGSSPRHRVAFEYQDYPFFTIMQWKASIPTLSILLELWCQSCSSGSKLKDVRAAT